MYIYIGGDKVLRIQDIISIIDANDVNIKKNSSYLVNLEKSFQLERINNEIRSIILTKEKVYYSPICTGTLNKRANE